MLCQSAGFLHFVTINNKVNFTGKFGKFSPGLTCLLQYRTS